MSDVSKWEVGIKGNFPIHKAVTKGKDAVNVMNACIPQNIPSANKEIFNFAVLPRGTKVVSADSCGVSAWTTTAKVSVILPDGSPKKYFLKVNKKT